jgi:hypothetical protein
MVAELPVVVAPVMVRLAAAVRVLQEVMGLVILAVTAELEQLQQFLAQARTTLVVVAEGQILLAVKELVVLEAVVQRKTQVFRAVLALQILEAAVLEVVLML